MKRLTLRSPLSPRPKKRRIGIEPLEHRNLLVVGPQLLDDINQSVAENPGLSVTLGSYAYLFVDDHKHGRELWKTDGTGDGTSLVKDLVPGPFGSKAYPGRNTLESSDEIVVAGDRMFFIADDEVWVSDGTESGTRTVKDDSFQQRRVNARMLTAVGDRVFFAGWNGADFGLWTSDGTDAGTIFLRKTRPLDLLAVGSTLYGILYDDDGMQLWKSDGTLAGTVALRDVTPSVMYHIGPQDDLPTHMGTIDGVLFFNASDGEHGTELWRSDGTAEGTVIVADLAAGETSSDPYGFTNAAGALYFTATTVEQGRELWKLESAGSVPTLVRDINPGPDSSLPEHLTAVGDLLFFRAGDGVHGHELWKSDGTEAGTVLVADIASGSNHSSPHELVALGTTLFFSANDQVHGRELWRSDGTAAGTMLVFEAIPGAAGNDSTHGVFGISASNDYVLFGVGTKALYQYYSWDYYSPAGPGDALMLWRSDGTAAGTFPLDPSGPRNLGSHPYRFLPLDDKVLFKASDGNSGQTLLTAGSGLEQLPAELLPGNDLIAINGFVFGHHSQPLVSLQTGVPLFSSDTPLWKSDGTVAGTVVLRPAGLNDPQATLQLLSAIGVGQGLFFTDDNRRGDLELWYSDGTAAGTRFVKDLCALGASAEISGWADVDGTLIFALSNAGAASGIWKSDGTTQGTVLVKSAASALVLGSGQGVAYLNLSDAEHGEELWKTDGTAAGTMLVKDIIAGPGSSSPVGLAATEKGFYFAVGNQLWKTDGTTENTRFVSGIGGGGTPPYQFPTAVGEELYFVLVNADGTRALWNTGGYLAGPFSASDGPRDLQGVNGKLYFTAGDDAHGRELWESDGTIAGTHLSSDIYPGPASSEPRALTSIGGTLYFSADDGIHGHEPWTLQAPPGIVNVLGSGVIHARDTFADQFFLHLTVASEGPQPVTVQVTVDDPAKGAFTEASLTASGFVAMGGAVYRFVGSTEAANQALHQLSFKPTENRTPLWATEITTFTIQVDNQVTAVTTAPVQISVTNYPKTTVAVFAPQIGTFFLDHNRAGAMAENVFQYGPQNAGWVPLSGDWDGDGVDSPGLYDPATGRFFLRNSTSPGAADIVFQYGAGGARLLPVVGDWDNDQRDTIAVFDPQFSVFFLRNSNTAGDADLVFHFGAAGAGWLPIAGNWDGNVADNVGLYSPSGSVFYLRNSHEPGPADITFQYGAPGAGWLPLAGNWDGDVTDTVGLYAPTTGTFYLRNEHAAGPADLRFTHGPGGTNWLPVVGDWDGPPSAPPELSTGGPQFWWHPPRPGQIVITDPDTGEQRVLDVVIQPFGNSTDSPTPSENEDARDELFGTDHLLDVL